MGSTPWKTITAKTAVRASATTIDTVVAATTIRCRLRSFEVKMRETMASTGRPIQAASHICAAGRIEMPALRYREGDVQLLARHFWSELGGNTNAPVAGAGEMLVCLPNEVVIRLAGERAGSPDAVAR